MYSTGNLVYFMGTIAIFVVGTEENDVLATYEISE